MLRRLIFLTAFIFSLSLSLTPFFAAHGDELECTWRDWTKLENGQMHISCLSDEIKSNGKCPGEGNGKHCCCKKVASAPAAATTPPKFEIPDLQVPFPTASLSAVTCEIDSSGGFSCPIPWIGEYVVAAYNYEVGIAGILAAIVLMAGGVLWLISGGDPSKITQAKELITGSITGLVILMSSYILLLLVNPKLVGFKPISLSYIKEAEISLAAGRYSSTAESYRNSNCPTLAEITNGKSVDFYATGYYKPAWENTEKFWCVVGMQCSCPWGRDTSKNCDFLYGETFPNYHPCLPFDESVEYCHMTASGPAPQLGDIAGPDCPGVFAFGDQVCFKNKTYTITDSGGGIKGRRIDIWSGSSLNDAKKNTGVGKLKKGPCP